MSAFNFIRLVCAIQPFLLSAQSPLSFQEAVHTSGRTYPGQVPPATGIWDLATLPDGSFIVNYQGLSYDADFGPGYMPTNVNRSSVAKYDSQYQLTWQLEPGTVEGTKVAGDDLYIYGNVFGFVVDLDPGAGVYPVDGTTGSRSYIAKINGSNVLEEVYVLEPIAANSGSTIRDVQFDPTTQDLVVVGSFFGTVDFDPGSMVNAKTATGGADPFMLRLLPSGVPVYTHTFDGIGSDGIGGCDIDSNGDLVVCGWYAASLDLDPGPGDSTVTNTGAASAFIAKYSPGGEFIWGRSTSGPGACVFNKVLLDEQDAIWAEGLYTVSVVPVDVDPGPGVAPIYYQGGYQAGADFLVKYSSSGDYSRSFGFNGHRIGDWQVQDSVLYVSGSIAYDPASPFPNVSSQFDLDMNTPATTTLNLFDGPGAGYTFQGFLAAYDNISGALEWVQPTTAWNTDLGIPSAYLGEPEGIHVPDDSTVFITNLFTGAVDVDLGLDTVTVTGDSIWNLAILRYRLCTPLPNPTIANGAITILVGETVDLEVTSTPPAPAGVIWQWYEGSCGGQPVGSGATVAVSPTQTGTYFVRAESSCSGAGPCASVDVTVSTGMDALTQSGRPVLWPNPSAGHYSVDLAGVDARTARVISATGAVLQSHTIEGRTLATIDLSGHAPGIYTVEIISATGTHRFRAVKR